VSIRGQKKISAPLNARLTPNEKGERCGGANPKTSAAKSPDENTDPLAEAYGSAAFAPPTGSAC
jgi:hypothetical protein